MLVENSQSLRNWLQTCLAKFSDADPVALAKYVVALVKKDKEADEMYNFLLDQLDIFLHRGTKEFVDLLFEQLRTKAYLASAEAMDVEKVSSTTCEKVTIKKSMLSPAERKMMELRIAESKRKEQILRAGSLANKLKSNIEKNTKRKDSEREKIFKRCKDYDEKGYCVEGDKCQFDHGSDPVVVDGVSILNFNVKSSDSIERVSSALIPEETTNIEEMRPTFPLCAVPIPKNVSPCQLLPPPPPPPPLPPPPPPLPPLEYMPEAYNPEAPGMNPEEYPPFYSYNTPMYSKQPRNRELLGVTIEGAPETSMNKKYENAAIKRKLPVYSRLGPNPKKRNLYEETHERKNTLLLRKVPPELNNIMSINEHFTKFGKVTNIEVCFENSPDSALVKFQYPFEAAAAYKSAEAVMNNRFIKLFYYKPNLGDRDSDELKRSSENMQNEENGEVKTQTHSTRDRLMLNNYSTRSPSAPSRTVFNSSSSSFVLNKNDSSLRSHKDEKKGSLNKRLVLHKKMGAFLKTEIDHQKAILDELNKTKNPKKRLFLKTTLKDLQTTITKLQTDLKKSSDELRRFLTQNRLSKTETEKQLLDAEIDLYKGQNSGTNEAALLLKVNELKAKARALGLLPNGSPNFALGDKASSNPVTPHLLKKESSTLLVSGLKDKDVIKKHFSEFGEIKKINDSKLGYLVCFTSRKAAEMAFLNGKEIEGDKTLTISWYETQRATDETSGIDACEDKDEKPCFGDDDDEEEEDNESRSWRH